MPKLSLRGDLGLLGLRRKNDGTFPMQSWKKKTLVTTWHVADVVCCFFYIPYPLECTLRLAENSEHIAG